MAQEWWNLIFLGVGLLGGAFATEFAEGRRERRAVAAQKAQLDAERRVAARAVFGELLFARAAIDELAATPDVVILGDSPFLSSRQWGQHQATLLRHLSEAEWRSVIQAYLTIDLELSGDPEARAKMRTPEVMARRAATLGDALEAVGRYVRDD